jgi:prefoldin subunit 5
MSKEKDIDEIKELKKRVSKLTKKLEEIGNVYRGHGIYESRQDIDIFVGIIKAMSEAIDILEKRIEALEKANK